MKNISRTEWLAFVRIKLFHYGRLGQREACMSPIAILVVTYVISLAIAAAVGYYTTWLTGLIVAATLAIVITVVAIVVAAVYNSITVRWFGGGRHFGPRPE
jgi:hypothetical protein